MKPLLTVILSANDEVVTLHRAKLPNPKTKAKTANWHWQNKHQAHKQTKIAACEFIPSNVTIASTTVEYFGKGKCVVINFYSG